tara:strand:- start:774 stop:938 length:165 start_codon:yes stop_codon:yes gene_type:complete
MILNPILDGWRGNPAKGSWRVTGWSLPSTGTHLSTVFIEIYDDFMSCAIFTATN